MVHRFLTLSQIPELRSEPSSLELGLTDIEISVPVDVLWQIEELIREIKYLKLSEFSTARSQAKLMNLIRPFTVNEKDRDVLFSRNSAA